jgi:hypothetical protein
MDVFEEWMDESWQKNARDRKDIMTAKKAACICPVCHAQNKKPCDVSELIYCISRKSPLSTSDTCECNCTKCSVSAELGLQYQDFCLKGSEAAQRYTHEAQ